MTIHICTNFDNFLRHMPLVVLIMNKLSDYVLFYSFSLFVCLFTGWMYDQNGSYDSGFVFLGVMQATGALIFAANHLRQNYNRNS